MAFLPHFRIFTLDMPLNSVANVSLLNLHTLCGLTTLLSTWPTYLLYVPPDSPGSSPTFSNQNVLHSFFA